MTQPTRARRNAPKPDPRTVLLAAGRRLFAERGFDGVSIEDIAAAAGMAKGLLYYYFASKRALYLEIVRLAGEDLAERTRPDPALPPLERTAEVIDAAIQWAKDYGEPIRLILGHGIAGDPQVQAILREGRERQVDMMLAGMGEIRAELGLPPVAPDPVLRYTIRGWIAFIEAALVDWLDRADLTEDQLRDLILRALGSLLGAARQVPR